MARISKSRALAMLQSAAGKFCSVTFMKKDKTVRKLNGKVLQVPASPLGYLKMNETRTKNNKGGIKNVNLQTLKGFRMNKTEYTVA